MDDIIEKSWDRDGCKSVGKYLYNPSRVNFNIRKSKAITFTAVHLPHHALELQLVSPNNKIWRAPVHFTGAEYDPKNEINPHVKALPIRWKYENEAASYRLLRPYRVTIFRTDRKRLADPIPGRGTCPGPDRKFY